MVIVIIHWKIRCDQDSLRRFRETWRAMELPEPKNFAGEYLSEPLSPEDVRFPCTTFKGVVRRSNKSYFNVGIWKDIESFRGDVIDNYVGGGVNGCP